MPRWPPGRCPAHRWRPPARRVRARSSPMRRTRSSAGSSSTARTVATQGTDCRDGSRWQGEAEAGAAAAVRPRPRSAGRGPRRRPWRSTVPPRCPPGAPPRLNIWKDVGPFGSGTRPGPRPATATSTSPSARSRAETAMAVWGGAKTDRVVEQIGEHLTDEEVVDVHEREVVLERRSSCSMRPGDRVPEAAQAASVTRSTTPIGSFGAARARRPGPVARRADW